MGVGNTTDPYRWRGLDSQNAVQTWQLGPWRNTTGTSTKSGGDLNGQTPCHWWTYICTRYCFHVHQGWWHTQSRYEEGGGGSCTNLRIHFLKHHTQDRTVVMEEGNKLHPLCTNFDMFVPCTKIKSCHPTTVLFTRGWNRSTSI